MVYKYQIINKLMKVLGVSEDVAEIVYQYYLTYERRKKLMRPNICPPYHYVDFKNQIEILNEHRKLDLSDVDELYVVNCNPVPTWYAYGNYIDLSHPKLDEDYGCIKNGTPSNNILLINQYCNNDKCERNDLCMMCMEETFGMVNTCENPKCFFNCDGVLCNDCIQYYDHPYSDIAENYNDTLKLELCGRECCDEYFEEELDLINNGLYCLECKNVCDRRYFGDYPEENQVDEIECKFCDDCYEKLTEDCEYYWEQLKEAVFIEKVHKRIKDFWKGYEPHFSELTIEDDSD